MLRKKKKKTALHLMLLDNYDSWAMPPSIIWLLFLLLSEKNYLMTRKKKKS